MFIGHLMSIFAAAATAVFAAVAAPAPEGTVLKPRAATTDATTVIGTITSQATNFAAAFTINSTTHTFTGTTDLLLSFTFSANSTLTYTQDSQIIGSQSFTGTEGQGSVTVNLITGATITWILLPPVSFSVPISGNGSWS